MKSSHICKNNYIKIILGFNLKFSSVLVVITKHFHTTDAARQNEWPSHDLSQRCCCVNSSLSRILLKYQISIVFLCSIACKTCTSLQFFCYIETSICVLLKTICRLSASNGTQRKTTGIWSINKYNRKVLPVSEKNVRGIHPVNLLRNTLLLSPFNERWLRQANHGQTKCGGHLKDLMFNVVLKFYNFKTNHNIMLHDATHLVKKYTNNAVVSISKWQRVMIMIYRLCFCCCCFIISLYGYYGCPLANGPQTQIT